MIVVVRIGEEKIPPGKNKGAAHVYSGQMQALGVCCGKNIFLLISQTLSGFVPQVQTRLLVPDYLRRILYIYGSVVGGEY